MTILSHVTIMAMVIMVAGGSSEPKPAKGQETFLVSFPKSGRTWLRLMIGYVLNLHFDLNADPGDILELDPLVRLAKKQKVEDFPVIAVDHAKKELELVAFQDWKFPEQFRGQSVLLLVRDPRDVFVSNWFEKSKRKMGLDKKELSAKGFTAETLKTKTADCSWIQQGQGLQHYLSRFGFQKDPFCNTTTNSCSCFHPDYTMLDFMREPQGGFDTILHFSSFFFHHRSEMNRFALVRYEDLHATPEKSLRECIEFLGVVGVSDQHIHRAVVESSFAKMRQKEVAGTFGWRLSARNPNDTDTFKTREGKVGGYRDHFEAKTLQMMEQQMRAILPPEFGYRETDL